MRPMLRPAQSALLRAIGQWLDIERKNRYLPILRVESLTSEPWHSATFNGERHNMSIRVEGVHAVSSAAFIAGRLGEAELIVPGQIVADVNLVRQETVLDACGAACLMAFEVLTVEE